jgi:hypothetical protein
MFTPGISLNDNANSMSRQNSITAIQEEEEEEEEEGGTAVAATRTKEPAVSFFVFFVLFVFCALCIDLLTDKVQPLSRW